MLVLSRHRDESIMIGDDVVITIVDIRGDKVRLGIKAPARVAVHRKEVYDAIKRENEQAARARLTVQMRWNSAAPAPAKATAAGRTARVPPRPIVVRARGPSPV